MYICVYVGIQQLSIVDGVYRFSHSGYPYPPISFTLIGCQFHLYHLEYPIDAVQKGRNHVYLPMFISVHTQYKSLEHILQQFPRGDF